MKTTTMKFIQNIQIHGVNDPYDRKQNTLDLLLTWHTRLYELIWTASLKRSPWLLKSMRLCIRAHRHISRDAPEDPKHGCEDGHHINVLVTVLLKTVAWQWTALKDWKVISSSINIQERFMELNEKTYSVPKWPMSVCLND